MTTEATLLLPFVILWPLLLGVLCLVPKLGPRMLPTLPLGPLPALAAVLLAPRDDTFSVRWILLDGGLRLTDTGAMFLGGAGLVWLCAGVYALRYMRGDPRAPTFVLFWMLVLAGNLGVFLAADLASFYVYFALVSLAAYPLARLNVPHKNLFLLASVVMRMVPAMILIIPMFLLLRNFRLLDKHLGLIIVYTTFLLPYVIWMLKNFFEQVPYALEAAARMDGCSRLGALFRVLIPVTAPGIVATAIFAFIGAWNEFLFGLILSTNFAVPVTVRLSSLVSTTFHSDNSLVAAAGMLTLIPPVLLVFILNRYIIRGLVEGIKF